ncbi:DUF1810 domain-containing protein [Hydrogenophaga sp.]|uniref:DUF1810 domain-containing protein n=1 Tax=Hydrogenophaga sp. TaxID=1904254 RepID=UPI0027282932|nr:DUF1810 domain-containing protein [Hydrogenophaga sp.]MDO9438634.1 DUF1810 domain-containing protein [Hydrogenophaga sp.]
MDHGMATSLERFVQAQERDYAHALAELQSGRKRTHWIWYVLPQLKGLGQSAMAERYGIRGRAEAEAYVAHPVLGPRLVACVQALLAHADLSAEEMLGGVDALKLRSCLTLFAQVAPGERCFVEALDTFYAGQRDARTLGLL